MPDDPGPREPDLSVPLEQLAAVRVLMGAERRAEDYDILIATALEALAPGAKTLDQLGTFVNSVWPGAGIDSNRLIAAMTAAASAQLVTACSVGEERGWALTDEGVTVQAAAGAANDLMDETQRAIKERAGEGLRKVSDGEVLLWAGVLSRAISLGIQAAYAAFLGNVSLRGDYTIAPSEFDVPAMLGYVVDNVPSPDVQEFLQAQVLAAVDPADPFANGLVSGIATGFMLHAFLARRDNPAAREIAGSLRGQRVFLDTPALLTLLGGDHRATAVDQGIRTSTRFGLEVIVFEHYLEELREVVANADWQEAADALREGAAASTVRTLAGDDDVIGVWLTGVESNIYRDWPAFDRASGRLKERLTAMGVNVRSHHNEDAGDTENVAQCLEALEDELRARGAGRSNQAKVKDANTMAAVWRTRRRHVYDTPSGRLWPGGWVVNMDSRMGPAYSRVVPADELPLVLTPSQWIGLVAACGDPVDVEELAESVVTLVAHETRLSIARGFNTQLALELARTLSPSHGFDTTDVRVLQLTVSDILDDQPDIFDEPETAGARLAGAVLARKAKRMGDAFKMSAAAFDIERRDLTAKAVSAEETAKQERGSRREADSRSEQLEKRLVQLQTEKEDQQRLANRKVAVATAVTLLAVLAFFSLWFGSAWVAVGMGLSAGLLWAAAIDWIEDVEVGWRRLLLALLPQVATIIGLFRN